MSEPKSFLAGVKDEINSTFAGVYDDLAEICPADELLGTTLTKLRKEVWEIVEKNLKQSYLNGKKASGNGADKAPRERKANPFRKE